MFCLGIGRRARAPVHLNEPAALVEGREKGDENAE